MSILKLHQLIQKILGDTKREPSRENLPRGQPLEKQPAISRKNQQSVAQNTLNSEENYEEELVTLEGIRGVMIFHAKVISGYCH